MKAELPRKTIATKKKISGTRAGGDVEKGYDTGDVIAGKKIGTC